MSQRGLYERPRRFGWIAALAFIAVGFWAGQAWQSEPPAPVPPVVEAAPRPVAPRTDLTAAERSTIELFDRLSGSVTYITSTRLQRGFFRRNITEIPQGTGSGFIWDKQGHVVTNFHVIQKGNRAQVTLADQSTWPAILVGGAPDKDLAVLRIEAPAEQLLPIPVGRSDDLLVGQFVMAIGNPFGLDQSLSTGIISALGREIESVTRIPIRGVIQTDAAINPGNSGGPLLDSSGRLIGVNTAIYSPSGAYAGVGFSIPVDVVNWVVPELIEHGYLRRPSLGIETVPQRTIRRLGLDVQGALVLHVVRRGPADQAGILPTMRDEWGRILWGDLIVELAGESIRTEEDLLLALEQHEAGDVVEVVVLRDGVPETLEVELGASR